jgi:hypothetical protein
MYQAANRVNGGACQSARCSSDLFPPVAKEVSSFWDTWFI